MRKIGASGVCKLFSIMDQAQGKRTHLGNAMGFGRMDHGASMEMNFIGYNEGMQLGEHS